MKSLLEYQPHQKRQVKWVITIKRLAKILLHHGILYSLSPRNIRFHVMGYHTVYFGIKNPHTFQSRPFYCYGPATDKYLGLTRP